MKDLAARPRVNVKKRLILVYCNTLEAWSLHKMTKNNTTSQTFPTVYAFVKNYKKALKEMQVPVNGFVTVTGLKRFSVDTWDEYVAKIYQHHLLSLNKK